DELDHAAADVLQGLAPVGRADAGVDAVWIERSHHVDVARTRLGEPGAAREAGAVARRVRAARRGGLALAAEAGAAGDRRAVGVVDARGEGGVLRTAGAVGAAAARALGVAAARRLRRALGDV